MYKKRVQSVISMIRHEMLDVARNVQCCNVQSERQSCRSTRRFRNENSYKSDDPLTCGSSKCGAGALDAKRMPILKRAAKENRKDKGNKEIKKRKLL